MSAVLDHHVCEFSSGHRPAGRTGDPYRQVHADQTPARPLLGPAVVISESFLRCQWQFAVAARALAWLDVSRDPRRGRPSWVDVLWSNSGRPFSASSDCGRAVPHCRARTCCSPRLDTRSCRRPHT